MIKDFHKTAIIAGNRYVSYKEMLRRITYFARYTSPHAGAKTVILSENREGWIYAFFSIWLNRGIAVPVRPNASGLPKRSSTRHAKPCVCWDASCPS